jgi:uncharacterized protein
VSPPDDRDERKRALLDLRALYARIDAALHGWACEASTDCCRFGVTGREPYPTAVEVAELERAVRARGGIRRGSRNEKRRTLPVAGERRCALLGENEKCLVYASRPFGCRTFFCERARSSVGEEPSALPKREIAEVSRAIADLSARFEPRDPGPRPLSKVTNGW